MKVVIAEKPSVGKDLARVMGAKNAKEGFVEGNGYAFTWAFGHLVQLAYPEDYGFTEWSKDNLPMLPDEFKLVIKQKKEGKTTKADPGAKKQLKIITDLLKSADEIIVATDAGREGELIYRYIHEYAGIKKAFKRLWISSQTDTAIKAGFSNLKEGKEFDNLFQSARARSESDWLIGLNATQALSLSVGNRSVYSLGRVQTPTLVMICERFIENRDFVPEIYFQIEVDLEKNGQPFTATSELRWTTKEKGEITLSEVMNAGKASVTSVDVKERTETVPLLYDLTSLQKDANRKFGFSADKTLEIAQTLYESKLITYPRTGSRYIGEDVFQTIPALIDVLSSGHFKSAALSLAKKKLNRRSVNAEKVTDHHALLPTENKSTKLNADEENIYNLVAGRMLEAFGEDCIKVVTTAKLNAAIDFIAKGVYIKYAGWRSVLNEQEEGEENSNLPELVPNEKLLIKAGRNVQKQTKPKPLHTEGSLLSAMQTCGREIEDEAAREAMKDVGLGTPATRAAIIQTLFRREYIENKKKSLIPTAKGLAVFEIVKDLPIGSPTLTGEWEKKLLLVEKGNLAGTRFMSEIRAFAADVTETFLNAGSGLKVSQESAEAVELSSCPKCKSGKVKFINQGKFDGAACSDRQGCGFVLFRNYRSKNLTDKQLTSLIETGKTGSIKFLSKDKKPYEGTLKLNSDFKIEFLLNGKEPAPPEGEQETKERINVLLDATGAKVLCPKCSSELNNAPAYIACSADRGKCNLYIRKVICEKQVPVKEIIQIIQKGRSEKMGGFISAKTGKAFEMRLKLNLEKGGVEFDFTTT